MFLYLSANVNNDNDITNDNDKLNYIMGHATVSVRCNIRCTLTCELLLEHICF